MSTATLPPARVVGDWALLRRLLPLLRPHPWLLAGALLTYPLNALCVVLPPYLMQRILDRALPAGDTHMLGWLTAVYFAALVAEYLSGMASEVTMGALGQRAMHALRARLFAHVQQLPSAYFDRTPVGRVLTRLTADVEALSELFASGAVTIVGDLLTVAAVVAMMVALDARLTLYAFLVAPPLLALAAIFQRFARTAFRAIRTHIARINAALAEFIGAMSLVQAFGQEARVQAQFDALGEAYRDANQRAIFFDAALFAIVEAVGTWAVAALIWFGAAGLASQTLSAGLLVAFIQYIRRFFVPIRDLSTKYTVLQSAFAGAERALSLLDEPVTIASPPAPQPLSGLGTGLALRAVSFAYVPAPRPEDLVLHAIDLEVAAGERVALVGATGSGKSSILRLFGRFYDVHAGAVTVDGHDVRTVDLAQLRALFATVQQDVHFFAGTLEANLTLGDPGRAAAVRRAVEAVGAADLVRALPEGYATQVTARAGNFSAGERQLLALARALARDPAVLILDEATSHVDSETEARIAHALEVVLRGRTAVIVAHRLSTIRQADRIVVLAHGRIVESGNHATLMARRGHYHHLVQLQEAGVAPAAAAGAATAAGPTVAASDTPV